MSNSRKPHNLKVIDGTVQKCRETEGVELPLVDSVPPAPDWLPNTHAVNEWQRLASVLTANRLLT